VQVVGEQKADIRITGFVKEITDYKYQDCGEQQIDEIGDDNIHIVFSGIFES
jgi:hypothetical protein